MKLVKPLLLALGLHFLAAPAQAYVDFGPTLGKVINEASHIVVMKVDKVSTARQAIIFKKVADLKGKHPAEEIKHQITEGLHPREPRLIMDWAEPGQTAIFFYHGPVFITCIGRYWYQGNLNVAPWWTMTLGRPELSLAYFGSADGLRRHVADMLAGKEVEITALRYTNHSRVTRMAAIFRNELRGSAECPIERMKASLKMPGYLYEISGNAKYELGPARKPEDVPALIERLQSPDLAVRIEAARELGDMGRQARSAAASLVKSLADPAASLRKAAAAALGDLGDDSAAPALRKALRDPEVRVRWQAADALGRIGEKAHAAVPDVLLLLKDKDAGLRGIAADALGAMGAYARAAVPALVQALKDSDPTVRLTSAIALVRIDPTASRPATRLFMEGIKSSESMVRLNYLTYLGMMVGYQAWEADMIPTLMDVMRTDPFWVTRVSAVNKLAAMVRTEPKLAVAALPGIFEALKRDPDPNNRLEYTRLLMDADILKHIGAKGKAEVIQALTEALQDQEPGVRIDAAKGLGGYGADSRGAVAQLSQQRQKDGHPDARNAAAEAIKKIQR